MKPISFFIIVLLFTTASHAQPSTDTIFKPHGVLGGLFFGDLAYKIDADTLKRGNLEYSGISKKQSLFNIRRLYLTYDYFLSTKFSAEMVLTYEGQTASTSTRNIFIKYLNLRWKNIFKGSDLYFGQIRTPTFSFAEKAWGYRSVEKTLTDMRQVVASSDLGVSLQGVLNKKGTTGYTVMVANGNGIRPENDSYKKLYTNFFVKFAAEKFIADVNYNYEVSSSSLHRNRQTFKSGSTYQTQKIAFGAEAFDDELNHFATTINVRGADTLINHPNERSLGVSVFLRNKLSKKITSFIRYDRYNPDALYNLADKYVKPYSTNNESFFTAGVDFQPIQQVHIIPNFWYNYFHVKNTSATNFINGNDLVARCTVFVTFK